MKFFVSNLSEAKTDSELKVALEKILENFPWNNAVQGFGKKSIEYAEAGGRHFEHLFNSNKKLS